MAFNRASGVYPERPDEKRFWLDVTLSRLLGKMRPRWSRPPVGARRLVARVEALDGAMRRLSDAELRQRADALRVELVADGFTRDVVARAFALVREATGRRLGMRQYPVQILGGASMLAGCLIEMNTGEGKTITALLPAATAALAGLPVHVITVNDYLAKRDAEQLMPVFEMLGLTVGIIQNGQPPPARRRAYACDVAYCTNKELAFDYLRDRIVLGRLRDRSRVQIDALLADGAMARRLVLRGLYFAIVDEADSVLVDEARVPLLISSESGDESGAALYAAALSIAALLRERRDYTIAQNERSIELTPAGVDAVERLTADLGRPWRTLAARRDLIQQALTATHLFHRDRHYIVVEDKVQIVDENTGRVMPDRFWERGLQQLIEAKEGCATTGGRETLARITYQRFFARYLRLAGMSGTLREVAAELRSVYDVRTVRIPPSRAVRRVDLGVRIVGTAERKWSDVAARVASLAGEGRPVLIGTRSVAASEEVAERLAKAGLPHVVLNARQDADEADIVAKAGREGAITVATSMAGRGTDILLAPAAREAGGLHVILTEYNESKRIDRQLHGRAGRQGDPGSFEVIAALEDDLFVTFAPRLARVVGLFGRSPVRPTLAALLQWAAQRRAERLHERVRRDNARHDIDMERALGFAGVAE